MSELPGKNPVLRAARALGHLIGRSSLSATGEFAAVDDVERNGHGGLDEEDFAIPEATYTTRPGGYLRHNPHPAGPTQAEINARTVVEAVMQADEAWDQDPPPMYLPDTPAHE